MVEKEKIDSGREIIMRKIRHKIVRKEYRKDLERASPKLPSRKKCTILPIQGAACVGRNFQPSMQLRDSF